MASTKEEFFNPVKLSSRDKAAATDNTARAIIEAEATARERKTEKLKNLRLEQEMNNPAPTAAPKKKAAAKTVRRGIS